MTIDWTWLGRPLAVDLANTVVPGPSGGEPVELLVHPGDLDGWLAAQGVRLPALEDGGAVARFIEFRVLRDDLRLLLTAAVDGGPYPRVPVARINAAAAAAMSAPCLELTGGVLTVAEHSTADRPSTEVLALIAGSAMAELTPQRRQLLRSCAAPGCGAFYVAGRARQHWCSDACGNRARVARHAARRKAATT